DDDDLAGGHGRVPRPDLRLPAPAGGERRQAAVHRRLRGGSRQRGGVEGSRGEGGRMTVTRSIAMLALCGVLAAVLVVVRGGDPYVLRLELADANGLIKGSPVTIGSVDVGKVADLAIGPRGDVVARLELDRHRGPVGRDVRAQVRAANLLGSKLVEIDPGDRARPLPSGATIPRARVETPVDLQDVFDV